MKKLTCEICGGTDLIKQEDVFVCQSCGCKYSADEVKKLAIEITKPVKIDGLFSLEDELKSADELMELHQYERAKEKYSKLCDTNPKNWECWWGLYQSSKIMEQPLYKGRDYRLLPPIEKYYKSALNLAPNDLKHSLEEKHNSDWAEYYNNIDFINYEDSDEEPEVLKNLRKVGKAKAELCNKVKNKTKLLSVLSGRKIEDIVKYKHHVKRFIEVREQTISFIAYYRGMGDDYATEHKECIWFLKRISDLETTLSEFKDDGCYIATSVYGSYDCPEVWTLRCFRDNTLAKSWYGRAFIKIYYTISPTLVKGFGHTKPFKRFWRKNLDKMVRFLNENGIKNDIYKDCERKENHVQ